ncbi:alpha/beta hydrolase-fold protein [Rhodococcus chondri]|uniref:Alpha/beta hydrolase-fold protein n=1 Tax=Rhodococcus chondri TaxID=3065941 RepID=A0ABU7JLP0_9NOCA|nr:alpha/beta hydrolase-fold protein [Rhodococcus sp. CC-R104]MEE2030774.1 alpha/beta hydrolase-fold protein [Rhodococcus sp. CC-R104]
MLGVVAATLVAPVVAGLTTVAVASAEPSVAQSGPVSTGPSATQASPGTTVRRIDWLTDRRVALWIDSPSMGTPIQVQLLLARDWNIAPDARFPAVFMLDGMRARDDENGWTYETDAESFFADKNVNVVLPVGGQSSFYSDWVDQNNGQNYKWETFLTKELPAILERDWRTTDKRGVVGLSMGGTAAMFLPARNPGFFQFAGSLSGILTTTTLGMPEAIKYAMQDAGGFDSEAMWGTPGGEGWEAHDPYLLADKLKGVSLYVSSGSGSTGPYDQPSGVPGVSTNYAGMGLEILSRLTSQAFATKLNKLGIPAQIVYRPSGTHAWPYWEFELHQLWPQLANTLGVEVTGPDCAAAGAIGDTAAANGWLGECLTPEYAVGAGRVQDFTFGRVFSADTGAVPVAGAIGGVYQGSGGPAGPLGYPTTGESGTPDGRGRFNHFQHGAIYWTPENGAHPVRGAIFEEWKRQGWEGGPLGYPVLDEARTPDGRGVVQGFEIGAMYWSEQTGAHAVQGMIMDTYGRLGYETGVLGYPTASEQVIKDNGRFSEFEHGRVYWSPATGAWPVREPVLAAWLAEGAENGRLGYPVGDVVPLEGGNGVRQDFQAGHVTVVDGKAAVSP